MIQLEVVNELSKKILSGDVEKDSKILIDVIDGHIFFKNMKNEEVESEG